MTIAFRTEPIRALAGGRGLHDNPARGLRLEVYMDAATGLSIYEWQKRDAIEVLGEVYAHYKEDHPKVAQVYFYLTAYWDKELDEAAFQHMDAYFNALKKLGLQALLRFAYVSAADSFDGQPVVSDREPTPARIVKHIYQLRNFLVKHKVWIYALQAGFLGVWGEWDFYARERMNKDAYRVDGKAGETAILHALLDVLPKGMYLQTRYRNIKSANVSQSHPCWNRIGFHDDFLISRPHVWNTAGGVIGSYDWEQLSAETRYTLNDGELIWGDSNLVFNQGEAIDAPFTAWRLFTHRFSTFSLAHNYTERNGLYSLDRWKCQPVLPNALTKTGMPFFAEWFDAERSYFEYVRDYLGYLLMVTDFEVDVIGNEVYVTAELVNYGFSAPHGLTDVSVSLMDDMGVALYTSKLCASADLQPMERVKAKAILMLMKKATAISISAFSQSGEAARFANDVMYMNGRHIFARRTDLV